MRKAKYLVTSKNVSPIDMIKVPAPMTDRPLTVDGWAVNMKRQARSVPMTDNGMGFPISVL